MTYSRPPEKRNRIGQDNDQGESVRRRTLLTIARRGARSVVKAGLAHGLLVAWALPAGAFTVETMSADEPAVVIDGQLTEDVWRRVPAHAAFAQLQPTAGAAYASGIRTQVQVVADGRALIIGIRAWCEQPPHVVLSRRDAVQRDQDMVGVWIDTGGRGESAMFLKASLAGVVTDGLYRASDDEEELGPDFPVRVATALLPDGYSMEIRWPLSALRYPFQPAAPWRMVVARAVPGAGDLLLVSGKADAEALNFLHASEPLTGLEPVLGEHRNRQEGDVTVEWTGRNVRTGEQTASRGSVGVEGWWRPRADWLVNATLNPDFAQVDIDAPQTNGNRAVALALPEKRRYFLESADVLGLPLSGFYSRTIADPRWGLRATWRGAGADATMLMSEDRAGTVVTRGRPWGTDEWTLAAPSTSEVFRGRWQPGLPGPVASADGDSDGEDSALTLGTLISRRSLGDGRRGQLAGVDGLWRSSADGRHWQAQWSLMASENTLATDDDGEVQRRAGPSRRDGSGWAKLLYSDDRWLNSADVTRVGPEFVNLLGFVDQAGLWRAQGEVNRRLGEMSLPGGGLLHQTEWHFGASEARSLRDAARAEPGNEVIRRELRTGFWLSTARRTAAWLNAGMDRQRARSGGRLHETPAWHGGVETTPFSWLARLTAEGSVGRQLDTDFDRVGQGGWWSMQASSRWALPQGRSLEFDPVFTGTRIRGDGRYPSLNETGLRLLGVLHLSAEESMRVIVQHERSARGAAGAEVAHTLKSQHRSVMWRKRFSSRYQVALGAQWDSRSEKPSTREVFLKLEAALGDGG
ncbi:hypothetical protein SAMN05216359_12239 [Roseateles sp. YR242]|uniref:hypothetical protein n=1 Tax=Roseateles sp. YR242 TaxID=1855305 RepID=UPI0008C5E051|nr:hypothetical protein [Roseateles sp. YR242]SEL89640.1 hypothetical protein SAMN05216359_12239 [Roseateles sp. YR242]